MLEQEIKLYVPVAARKAVAARLAEPPAQRRLRLRAMYFDTPDRRLARAQAALRLRQEGRRWVQTFKMAGADLLSRVELNHPRPGPVLDLSVYAGTPAESLLDGMGEALGIRYETDVLRARRELRTRQGRVEVAYDVGAVRAGGLELPLHEVEFELLGGAPAALFALAARWVRQYGLVLDLRSKAERGDRLADAAARIADASEEARRAVRAEEIRRFWAPVGAVSVMLPRKVDAAAALDLASAACLEQVARNTMALAAVDDVDAEAAGIGAEHVHQLRVGMRRLRSAWRLFEGWTPLPPEALRAEAVTHFAAFGVQRDQDVQDGVLAPALRRAGLPAAVQADIAPASAAGNPPSRGDGGKPFQLWLLGLLGWCAGVRSAPASPEPTDGVTWHGEAAADAPPAPLRPRIKLRLQRWHRRVVAAGRRWASLDDEARHGLRKRAKRLRYALSLSESLFPAARLRRYRKALAALQDVLGEFNDLVVARARYTALAESRPEAWFGLGWIAARLEALDAEAAEAMAVFAQARLPWRR